MQDFVGFLGAVGAPAALVPRAFVCNGLKGPLLPISLKAGLTIMRMTNVKARRLELLDDSGHCTIKVFGLLDYCVY